MGKHTDVILAIYVELEIENSEQVGFEGQLIKTIIVNWKILTSFEKYYRCELVEFEEVARSRKTIWQSRWRSMHTALVKEFPTFESMKSSRKRPDRFQLERVNWWKDKLFSLLLIRIEKWSSHKRSRIRKEFHFCKALIFS